MFTTNLTGKIRLLLGALILATTAAAAGEAPHSTIVLAQADVERATPENADGAREGSRTEIEEIIVSATRTTRSDKAISNKVTFIDAAEIQIQQSLTLNPTELLSNILPSYSPTRQKLTGLGESFRGRRPLFLIDGVPQSNPLRDGSRDGFTIDMSVIEEIEVIHGANAIQGLGATGGIVNFITVRPPDSGELDQHAQLGTSMDDDFDQDGYGYLANYRAGQRIGQFDFVASVGWEKRGIFFDGEDRTVGVDETQGDVADSESRNLFFKVGFEPSENQRIQFMINDFLLEMDDDFVSIDGDRSAGIPTTSVRGSTEGAPAKNDVTTMTLNYANTDLLGGRFTGQWFYQDFAGIFGGGSFGIFQDPAIAPVGTLFDQSANNSEKTGLRFTQGYTSVLDTPFDIIFGLDFLQDETYQELIFTGRNWVPTTEFNNYAPFAQLDVDVTSWLSVTGGGRWEFAELDVPPYTTLAGNRADLTPVQVDGGKPDFDEFLYNFGAVVQPNEMWSVYGTYSEGFTMPDVGRVLRGVSEFGTDADTFLDLAPLVTENIEFGVEYEGSWGNAQVAWFQSLTDFGVRLVPNADGIFEVNREKTEITGWEISASSQPLPWLGLGIAYANLEGEFDSDDDGSVDADLGAVDVGPDRLNAYIDILPGGIWTARLQSFTYFDETFKNSAGATTAEFDGYTVVDAAANFVFGDVTVTTSISNLFDEQYITYYGQAGNSRNDRYFAGRGRALNLRVAFSF